jgi:hypothetical protein
MTTQTDQAAEMPYPNEPAGMTKIAERPVVNMERSVANAMRYWAKYMVPTTDDATLYRIWQRCRADA